jgi:hypothetical protein
MLDNGVVVGEDIIRHTHQFQETAAFPSLFQEQVNLGFDLRLINMSHPAGQSQTQSVNGHALSSLLYRMNK